jgi:hypothetical protein
MKVGCFNILKEQINCFVNEVVKFKDDCNKKKTPLCTMLNEKLLWNDKIATSKGKNIK